MSNHRDYVSKFWNYKIKVRVEIEETEFFIYGSDNWGCHITNVNGLQSSNYSISKVEVL